MNGGDLIAFVCEISQYFLLPMIPGADHSTHARQHTLACFQQRGSKIASQHAIDVMCSCVLALLNLRFDWLLPSMSTNPSAHEHHSTATAQCCKHWIVHRQRCHCRYSASIVRYLFYFEGLGVQDNTVDRLLNKSRPPCCSRILRIGFVCFTSHWQT